VNNPLKLKVLDVGSLAYKGTDAMLTADNILVLALDMRRLGYDAARLTVPIKGTLYTMLVLASATEDQRPEHFIKAPDLAPRLGLFGSSQDKAAPFTQVDITKGESPLVVELVNQRN